MRRAAKVDANQPAVVAALRAVGATVQPLHSVGSGCPDLVVGFRGATFLLEVKDGRKPPSDRRLTPAQEDWHGGWNGQVAVVKNEAEALAAIGAAVRDPSHQPGLRGRAAGARVKSGPGGADNAVPTLTKDANSGGSRDGF